MLGFPMPSIPPSNASFCRADQANTLLIFKWKAGLQRATLLSI